MKCPKCQNDHRKKLGSICSTCKYVFIFKDPKDGYKLSDNAFGHLLKKVSANGTRHYLTRHVQAAIALRPKKKSAFIVPSVFIIAIGTFILSGVFSPINPFLVFGLLSVIVVPISISLYQMSPDWPNEQKVASWLEAWQSRFGPLEYLISEKKCEHEPQTTAPKDLDVDSYGVQKILVVDEDLLVDFLVLNHWHTDQQTLVLSQTGYPGSALALANKNLTENQNCQIFLYHSSSQKNFEKEIRENGILRIQDHKVTSLGISQKMVESSDYFKKYYKNVPKGVVHADQIPTNTSLGVLTATVVGGVMFADMLDEEVQRNFEANLQSNFG